MTDPIIDRSPEQKRLRVNKLRAELLELGYSVVKTEWLHSVWEQSSRHIVMPSVVRQAGITSEMICEA